MHAADIMTTNVVTAEVDTEIRAIADLLLMHRISAVPVVDKDMKVVGLVSEGDLMRRVETGTDDRHSWWLADAFSTRDKTAEYIKSHGRRAQDVMTRSVVTVPEDMPLYEIAGLLEKHHIKRVPVTRDGKLVGIVSRANLLHGLATQEPVQGEGKATNDKELRDQIMSEISNAAGADAPLINATVKNGAVQLWGNVYSSDKRHAAEVAAECIVGVKSVENHIGVVPARMPYY